MSVYALSVDDVFRAQRRLGTMIHRTPMLKNRSLGEPNGIDVSLKCELLQRTGSFKIRGALNAVLQLDEDKAQRGVVTHSSGNHGQALALASKIRGISAHVVMPENASAVKRNAVLAYGAAVYSCAPTEKARDSRARELVSELGATFIPPFDHPDVIAGQGTIALELLEQCPELDTIIVPVGGGGMSAGIALTVASLAPGVRVIAAEPREVDDTYRSMKTGERAEAATGTTIADGLRTRVGELTWPIIRDHVADVIVVEEREIIESMKVAWQRTKLLIEASAAVGVAALGHYRAVKRKTEHVAVILCGGNVDLDDLPWQPQLY